MLTLKELTRGERLLVYRRRGGESAAEAAYQAGISLYAYQRWERDEYEGSMPRTPLGKLQLHEASFILRRRAGLGAAEFAKKISVSPWWLRRMERGDVPPDRLIEFWKGPKARARG